MKGFFKFIFILGCFLLVVLALLPYVLSQEWGKKAFLQSANYLSKSSLKIDKLSLSWIGQQHIEGIEWKDAQGRVRFACAAIETPVSLAKILFKHDLGSMTLRAPQAWLTARTKINSSLPVPGKMGFVSNPSPLADITALSTSSLAYHPLFKFNVNWIKYQGIVSIEQGEITFLSSDPLKLEKLDLLLSHLKKDELHIEAICQATEKEVTGTFTMTGALTHLDTPEQDISLQSKFLNFPIRSIDQTVALIKPQLEGFFIDLIGESLSADLTLTSSAKRLSIDIDASSSQFSAYARTETKNGEISLHSPALFTTTLSPSVLHKLTGVVANQDVTTILKINRLTLPLAEQNAFSFQAELRTSEVVMPSLTIDPMVISLSTENFQEGLFLASLSSPQVSCEESLFSWKEGFKLLKPAHLKGAVKGTIEVLKVPTNWEKLTVEAALELKLPQMEEPLHTTLHCHSIKDISLTLANSHFETALLGELNKKEMTFVIKDPVAFLYHRAPTDIAIEIDPCAIPLIPSEIEKLKISGQGKVAELILNEEVVKNLIFSFEGKGSSPCFKAQASGLIGDGSFELQLDAEKWMPETLLHLKARGTGIPTSSIAPFLGESVTFELDVTSSQKEQNISLKADSPKLVCDLALKQENDLLQLIKPSRASFKLTKESYTALEKWIGGKSPSFEITEEPIVQLNFSELTLPVTTGHNRLPSFVYDSQKTQFQGDFLIDKLSFLSPGSEETTTVNHLKIHLSQPSKKSPLAFQMSSSVGDLGVLSFQGSFDPSFSTFFLNGSAEHFPTTVCDFLTHSALPFKTIFGPTLNLTAAVKIQEGSGPLKVSFHSPHTRVSFDGLLTNGILTLNDTVYAQATLTPELGQLLLKDVNPLSSTIVQSSSPLSLEIPKEGVLIPFNPFSLQTAFLPHIKIELGKILCENKGSLSDLLGILQLSAASKEKELTAWFSPINLSLSGGLLTSARTDILLADTYQICSWGTIDFMKDDVNLILGLTAGCLKKAFHIKDLPETYVLQVPMTGPIANVQVGTSVATTQIAALLLWQQKSALGDLVGGSKGDLLGNLLNKIGPIPGGNNKAPPPSTPLPWEISKGDLSSHAPEPSDSPRKKKHFKPGENPLKQILKMVR